MATISPSPFPPDWTVADMLAQLGDVPVNRIRLTPLPGTATEQDVLDVQARTDRLCELIDGVLVEKTLGYLESLLAAAIASYLRQFVRSRNLGIVLGADGTLKILPRQVRIPDVCFIRWERFPGGQLPQVQIPAVAPDLAVEVLSPGNTEGEMQRKLRDYFAAGVRLVWTIDPATRTAWTYTSPEQRTTYSEADRLSGGEVLPGFELPLRELFAEIDQAQ
ncbi:MAG: Uma2 family endonuclease [Thermoguttaceae bacterium]|jgi:Uma2 family endonuclease